MKVLLIGPYPPERDGIGDYSAKLGDELRRQGNEFAAVTVRDAMPRRPDSLGAIARSGTERSRLEASVEDWKPDVAHLQFAVAAFGTRIPALFSVLRLLRSRGVPIVMTLHEITRDTASLRGVGRRLYARLLRDADRVIVHTRAARDAVAALGGDSLPAAVIPLARNELPPAEATPEALAERYGFNGSPVLLSFGFIDVDKGLGDLVEALGILKARQAGDVRLAVVGDVRARHGPFRIFELRDRLHVASIRRRVKALDMGSQVLFAGYVSSGEVEPWFKLASAAVLPYRRIEQSSVANLAAAAGTPVLASEVGGLPETALRTCPPRDPAALADMLEGFLADGGAARTPFNEENDLSEIARRTVAVYTELTSAAQ